VLSSHGPCGLAQENRIQKETVSAPKWLPKKRDAVYLRSTNLRDRAQEGRGRGFQRQIPAAAPIRGVSIFRKKTASLVVLFILMGEEEEGVFSPSRPKEKRSLASEKEERGLTASESAVFLLRVVLTFSWLEEGSNAPSSQKAAMTMGPELSPDDRRKGLIPHEQLTVAW